MKREAGMKKPWILWALVLVVAWSVPVWAITNWPALRTVLVNTNAADFTVVAAATRTTITVGKFDAQNLGTTNKVTLRLCDGACGSAVQIWGPFELSPATANGQGGSYSYTCGHEACLIRVTPGNALVAQVDTGATNNVRLAVVYQAYTY
jgi:hypothetical protein